MSRPAYTHGQLHPNGDQPGCPECPRGVFQISARRDVEVARAGDFGLFTPAGSLTSFGSHAACFLDFETAERVAAMLAKKRPGWTMRVVGVAGFRRPRENGRLEPKAKRTKAGAS